MSPLGHPRILLGALSAALLLLACSSSKVNPNATMFGASGHVGGWLPAGHAAAAKANVAGCEECHGTDLQGGITGGSCTTCHLGGPMSVHPPAWGSEILALHGPYATANGTAACSNALCHGTDLAGVEGSGPSCTSCHASGSHPQEWNGDALTNHRWYAFEYGTTLCAGCHGADLKGGTAAIGPSCESCHSPIPSVANCSTCHHFPPSGTSSPDIAGKHAKHTALRGADCSICHENHTSNNGSVEVAFAARFNAQSGTAVWNGVWSPLPPPGMWVASTLNCSEVICHGGQKTPDWSSGTIDVPTQCTACHAYGTSEYNSFSSGQHDYHVNTAGKACTDCHDATKLDESSNHFKYLDTPEMEGPASATLLDSVNYNPTDHSCSPSCHGTRTW